MEEKELLEPGNCKHEHIELCAGCSLPYCVDCGENAYEEIAKNHLVRLPMIFSLS